MSYPNRCANRNRTRRGFTLIEMLVVLSVIALLLSLVAPTYVSHVDRAQELTLKQNLKTVRGIIDQFHADRARDPVGVLGHGQHEHCSAGVHREQPAGRLHAADARHAYVGQDEVRALDRVAGEHLLAARSRAHPVDAGHGRHHTAQRLARQRGVVAHTHRCHR